MADDYARKLHATIEEMARRLHVVEARTNRYKPESSSPCAVNPVTVPPFPDEAAEATCSTCDGKGYTDDCECEYVHSCKVCPLGPEFERSGPMKNPNHAAKPALRTREEVDAEMPEPQMPEGWHKYGEGDDLAFCSSVDHVRLDIVRALLATQGLRVVSEVEWQRESASARRERDQAAALEQLKAELARREKP